MSTPNVNAHNATPLLEHGDGLLSPFATRQYSHLPTPQSPNTLGRYINEHPPSPETPVPHNTSITPASDKQRHEPWKSIFCDKATRLEYVTSQYATPESSPHFQPTVSLQHINPAAGGYPFHSLGFSTPKPSLSLPLEMETPLRAPSPFVPPSSHTPTLSSPFIGRISLDGSTTEQSGLPAIEPDDVFSVPRLYNHTAVKNTLSTPPVSPQHDTASTSLFPQAGGEMERIRQSVMEDTRNHIQEVEGHRPDYLKRAKRIPPEADPSYFAEDPNDREQWPPVGVLDSPQKGRRLKLFQETSDESFEESLMAGGYGRYRTTDWVRQPQPISLRSAIGSSSVVVSLLEKAEEAPATEKELKKQKRLSAFRSVLQSGSSKVRPVELEGKGRVLMEVASLESAISHSPEPSPSKRKGTNRRKRQPGGSSPDKNTRHTGSHEVQLEKPNWPDTEFPWRLRTEERNEEAKAVQEERLRWIERYLDRESDEDDDQAASHNGDHDSTIICDRDSRTSYQVKMGRGKMIPLSVVPDDPWNLIPKRSFPLDPADAREALLSKKSVRTLSYRQQKRKRREDDEDEDEVLCICRGEDDGRQLVQCDSCQMWYHLECIGIKNIAALGREEDPWYCRNCQARSRSPSTEIDDAPSSEPTLVPTDPLLTSRRSSDATLFQPAVPDSPNWSSTRLPRTPTRSIRNSLDTFRPSWNWADPSRPMPTTPRQHYSIAKVYTTPGPLDNGSSPYDDSPFDPASTPSRGIKFHMPFATPKATAWRPNSMLQTPSRNRGGTNKYHVHSASLDDNSLSAGSAIQYSFARVLPSDESPIRRNRSSDATFGRRKFLSPVRPMP